MCFLIVRGFVCCAMCGIVGGVRGGCIVGFVGLLSCGLNTLGAWYYLFGSFLKGVVYG